MSVIAFNFSKLLAERNKAVGAKYSIQAKTAIKDVKQVALGKQVSLQFSFACETAYEPGIGRIVTEGDVLVLSNEQEAKETLASFQKTKRFGAQLSEKVYNTILQRTTIESLLMARDIGLPPPVRLPRLRAEPAANAPAGAKPVAETKLKKK